MPKLNRRTENVVTSIWKTLTGKKTQFGRPIKPRFRPVQPKPFVHHRITSNKWITNNMVDVATLAYSLVESVMPGLDPETISTLVPMVNLKVQYASVFSNQEGRAGSPAHLECGFRDVESEVSPIMMTTTEGQPPFYRPVRDSGDREECCSRTDKAPAFLSVGWKWSSVTCAHTFNGLSHGSEGLFGIISPTCDHLPTYQVDVLYNFAGQEESPWSLTFPY
jgi:hypothetical protein